jgi:hypothetical protein
VLNGRCRTGSSALPPPTTNTNTNHNNQPPQTLPPPPPPPPPPSSSTLPSHWNIQPTAQHDRFARAAAYWELVLDRAEAAKLASGVSLPDRYLSDDDECKCSKGLTLSYMHLRMPWRALPSARHTLRAIERKLESETANGAVGDASRLQDQRAEQTNVLQQVLYATVAAGDHELCWHCGVRTAPQRFAWESISGAMALLESAKRGEALPTFAEDVAAVDTAARPQPTDCDLAKLAPPPPPKKLLLCGRCGKARYCTAECQRAHWKLHKKDCSQKSS